MRGDVRNCLEEAGTGSALQPSALKGYFKN